jgi:hypothetical protein
MPGQLDILALEPFFGGARRAMLQTIVRHSRHRWNVLTLPPRRIERRLAAAAQWFGEQLSRHWVGRVDLLFTSEAMNLSDLFRVVGVLARVPAVVYFHDNQLPEAGQRAQDAVQLVNLNTAMAATEIWFNSVFHLRSFVNKASALVALHEELASGNPIPLLMDKARHLPPPVDLEAARAAAPPGVGRARRVVLRDTREADLALLNSALGILARRNVKYRLITVGPVEGLDPDLARRTISEGDEPSQIAALHEAGIHIGARWGSPWDLHAIRALSLGCWPIHPKSGVYPELLPRALHGHCLYERSANVLANRLHDVYTVQQPSGYEAELAQMLGQFEAVAACRAIDDRLEQLVAGRVGA